MNAKMLLGVVLSFISYIGIMALVPDANPLFVAVGTTVGAVASGLLIELVE